MTLLKDGLQATLATDRWELESAVARHQQAPLRFLIPDEQERNHLQPGQRVQLLVLLEEEPAEDEDPTTDAAAERMIQCERLWLTIAQAEDTYYVGVLESEPVSSTVLAPGDRIRFAAEHIARILISRDDPRHPDFGHVSSS